MLTSDKFHDECGVVAIFAHPEAEKLAYLGLHALQHRGQESAGIVTSDGLTSRVHKAMGSVADIFTEDVLSKMRGTLAIGHTRYSTAGDSALLNAQPILVQSNKGSIALAHNGNLINAHAGARAPGKSGLDFPDQQRYRSHRSPDRAFQGADAARSHGRRAAPSGRRIFAGDDEQRPRLRGARSARLPAAGHGTHPGARGTEARHHRLRLRDLRVRSDRRRLRARSEAGRTDRRRAGGSEFALLFDRRAAIELHLRARIFLASRQHGLRPRGADQPRGTGPPTGAGSGRRGRSRGSRARFRRDRGHGLFRRERHSVSFRVDPQSLRRAHVHRAAARACATSA